jgi:hypothetical protein
MAGRPSPEIVACTWSPHEVGIRDRCARSRRFCRRPVPRVYEEIVIGGRTGLVMERLEGSDLLTIIGRKPWLVFRSGRFEDALVNRGLLAR